MVIQGRDSFADLLSLREAAERLFERSSQWWPGRGIAEEDGGARMLPLDLYEREKDYVLKAYLPGVKAGSVDIHADQSTVTIKAHVPEEAERQEAGDYRWLVNELSHGDVSRTVTLPGRADPARIEGVIEDGILTLTIPKVEASKLRRVSLKAKGK